PYRRAGGHRELTREGTTICSSREEAMAKPQKDDRDLLEMLQFELRFLEDGGYGQSPHAARRASLIFEDSLTCMNFNSQDRTPYSACLLMKRSEEHTSELQSR